MHMSCFLAPAIVLFVCGSALCGEDPFLAPVVASFVAKREVSHLSPDLDRSVGIAGATDSFYALAA